MRGGLWMGSTVQYYIYVIPLLTVWLVGICICIRRWDRHPKLSRLALILFASFFIETLLGTFVSFNLPMLLEGRHGNSGYGYWIIKLVWLARVLIQTVLWVLAIVAIFGWRNEPQQTGIQE